MAEAGAQLRPVLVRCLELEISWHRTWGKVGNVALPSRVPEFWRPSGTPSLIRLGSSSSISSGDASEPKYGWLADTLIIHGVLYHYVWLLCAVPYLSRSSGTALTKAVHFWSAGLRWPHFNTRSACPAVPLVPGCSHRATWSVLPASAFLLPCFCFCQLSCPPSPGCFPSFSLFC